LTVCLSSSLPQSLFPFTPGPPPLSVGLCPRPLWTLSELVLPFAPLCLAQCSPLSCPTQAIHLQLGVVALLSGLGCGSVREGSGGALYPLCLLVVEAVFLLVRNVAEEVNSDLLFLHGKRGHPSPLNLYPTCLLATCPNPMNHSPWGQDSLPLIPTLSSRLLRPMTLSACQHLPCYPLGQVATVEDDRQIEVHGGHLHNFGGTHKRGTQMGLGKEHTQ
jgi:hypothetical protein